MFKIYYLIILLFFPQNNYFISNSIRHNRCELKLVADYVFYRDIGNKNYANAARYLINLIERVNGIFSPIDWGLDINGDKLSNLGFVIKEMKILEQPEDSSDINHFNSIIQSDVNAVEILKSFSTEEGTNSTCLTVLITAKSLEFDVVDPEKRGVCAIKKLNDTFMNTALITVRRRSDLMLTRVVDLVLAHELGHSWGSLHDDEQDEECVPKNSRDGRFVMWESSNTGYDKNNYQFSSCSINSIHRVLYSIAHNCFVEEKKAFCGNGLLEEGEQCDSGAHFQHFGTKDDCCTRECKFKIGAFCSPRHSECCSMDCNFLGTDVVCHPQKKDLCKAETTCNGFSEKCPNPIPLGDGTNCTDEGKCLNGDCIPFCRLISQDLMPCFCEDAAVACQRCCRSNITGICSPIKPEQWLPDNSMCIHGHCIKKICEKEATDPSPIWRFFENIEGHSHRKFFADYIVFIVVIISLLIWCPCGAFIVYKDKKEQNELIRKRIDAQNNVQIISNEITFNKQSLLTEKQRSHSINEISQSRIEDHIKLSHSDKTLLNLKNNNNKIDENIYFNLFDNNKARNRNEHKLKEETKSKETSF